MAWTTVGWGRVDAWFDSFGTAQAAPPGEFFEAFQIAAGGLYRFHPDPGYPFRVGALFTIASQRLITSTTTFKSGMQPQGFSLFSGFVRPSFQAIAGVQADLGVPPPDEQTLPVSDRQTAFFFRINVQKRFPSWNLTGSFFHALTFPRTEHTSGLTVEVDDGDWFEVSLGAAYHFHRGEVGLLLSWTHNTAMSLNGRSVDGTASTLFSVIPYGALDTPPFRWELRAGTPFEFIAPGLALLGKNAPRTRLGFQITLAFPVKEA